MKRLSISVLSIILFASFAIAGGVEGTWNASIETEYGPFEFSVKYIVEGEKITGAFMTDMGDLEFGPGTIKGKKFEYTFEIEYVTYTHKGELISDNEILIKSSTEGEEESEFTMTRAE
jgi:hypothetical protein